MERPTRIILVDDDETLGQYLIEGIGKLGITGTLCRTSEEALAVLEVDRDEIDVVVSDVAMPGLDGLALTERVQAIREGMPMILMTGFASVDSAIAAIRAGASDYLVKPIEPQRLAMAIQRSRHMRGLSNEVKRLRTLVKSPTKGELIGDSPAMNKVMDLISRVAASDAAVLIAGESGTGKELVARALHANSARASGPFVAINSAAVPPTLLESELFGHVKGAFTDARGDRRGLFVEADNGTLFLDEVSEMPLEMQTKLLRALQQRTVRPVGGQQEVPFNARLLTASNRDLEAEVRARRFREDLYYRINVVRIDVPPLRDRIGDVLLLAQHFLNRAAKMSNKPVRGFTAAAAEKLQAYDWPGNVRELENCVQGAVAMARFEEVGVDDLPERVRAWHSNRVMPLVDTAEELVTLSELERRYTSRVLALVSGNKTRAAQILGIDRRTLYRMLRREGTPA
ncbi:MAG TPA: sigma-54 dependent transcriptional regulator [Archangium sp.]